MVTQKKSVIEELLQKLEERLRSIEVLLPISKVVLNIEEISKLTGLSKSTIYKLTCTARIPHYKQSKHLFFDREEVEAWLKSNPVKTQEEIEQEALSYITRKEGVK